MGEWGLFGGGGRGGGACVLMRLAALVMLSSEVGGGGPITDLNQNPEYNGTVTLNNHLKGLSHEIDFKNFDKKLHNLA